MLARKLRRTVSETFDASFVNTYSSTSDTNAYTFSASAIGASSPTRLVVVVAICDDANAVALSSLTIGGNAADIRVNTDTSAATGRAGTAIAGLLVQHGTTADIVVTWDEAVTACKIFVYRLVGYASATPTDTFVVDTTANNVTSRTVSIDTLTGGAVIGGARLGDLVTAIDVGQIDSQATVESARYVGFSYFPSDAATPKSLALTWDGTSTECGAVAAHWQAAA